MYSLQNFKLTIQINSSDGDALLNPCNVCLGRKHDGLCKEEEKDSLRIAVGTADSMGAGAEK